MTHWRDSVHQITLPTPFPVGPVHVYLLEGEPLTLLDTGPRRAIALAGRFRSDASDVSSEHDRYLVEAYQQ